MTDAGLVSSIDARGVATLTLDRPARANALDPVLIAALAGAIDELHGTRNVRAVVLRGSGRHFCGGVDVGVIGTTDPRDHDNPAPGVAHLCLKLDALDKPTIAVVHGAAIGGGCALVAACDIALATPAATFAMPEVRLGLGPVPLSPFLVRALGPRGARRYLISGERFDAATALRLGLVHEIVEQAELDARLAMVTDECLKAAPGALAAIKAALSEWHGKPPGQDVVSALEKSFQARLVDPEVLEGIASRREKRAPSWAVINSKDGAE